jgi:hypothetical protein
MMINVLVSAQYYENYSDTETPYWKPKGGVDFSFPVDSELVMYVRREFLENVLIKMVEKQSNDYSRYEYLSHEVKFSNPIVVEGLERELDWFYDIKNKNNGRVN